MGNHSINEPYFEGVVFPSHHPTMQNATEKTGLGVTCAQSLVHHTTPRLLQRELDCSRF